MIDPADARGWSIFIFDDVVCHKQDELEEYFSMSRDKSIEAAYLCQYYSKIPTQLIRDNFNVIVLFKQDDINLRYAYIIKRICSLSSNDP